jgi:hypothetical protein
MHFRPDRVTGLIASQHEQLAANGVTEDPGGYAGT